MENENHFGEWLKRRRRQLDLTRQQIESAETAVRKTSRLHAMK